MSNATNASAVLAAIVSLVALGLGTVMGILYLRPEAENTPLIMTIMGLLAPTVVSTLALLKVQETNDKLQETHVMINSRMTELLEKTGLAAHAEGVAAGVAQEQSALIANKEATAAATQKIADDASQAAAAVLQTAREKKDS